VPGAVAGLLLDHWAETVFRSPLLVGLNMAALGLVLWLADRRARRPDRQGPVSGVDALWIGCAQAFAILPGVSRSGSTISLALFLGYRREEAARFSFLLALPITAGAALVKVPKLLAAGGDRGPLLVGLATAAVSGFLAIRVLLAYVRSRDYRPFVYYRIAFALVVAALFLARSPVLR
jgi:undecaprenyl-diphosphatase